MEGGYKRWDQCLGSYLGKPILSIDTGRLFLREFQGTNGKPGARQISFLLEMRDHLNREQSLHDDGIVVVPNVNL
jgi:hypothetical protein